jgi:hypothetical protein
MKLFFDALNGANVMPASQVSARTHVCVWPIIMTLGN